MLIPRHIKSHLEELSTFFPIVSLTGPRQAGKTTLLKKLYADYKYISLEDFDRRQALQSDPRSFLKTHHDKIIFDEAQRVPELFSYLQTIVDENRYPGRFVLSGSQNFLLRSNITQSLAGRVGIAKLLPFDFRELKAQNLLVEDYETAIFSGFYPSHYDIGIPPRLFYPSYLESYVERDVKDLIFAGNLNTFQRFLKICAGHAGQLLNYSALSVSVGVSVATIKNWFSILEQSYITFRLPPYYKNFNKRTIKSPKLYFYDTGLLCYLLELRSSKDVENFYMKGALFENLIIAEYLKQSLHNGIPTNYYFYRDSNQNEIDLVKETASGYELTEIKGTRTLQEKFIKNINRIRNLFDRPTTAYLIYGGDQQQQWNEINVLPWNEVNL